MPITIQEIIASDTISQLVDKTNFNFDQILLNGGGPAGPKGGPGPTGPAGGRGPKGTTWYEDNSSVSPGVSPNDVPPTPNPLEGDYYLQFDGQVWEYNGNAWVLTNIDLQGPAGLPGSGGGFGLFTGAPIFNQQNIRYNGPVGAGNGATAINEGVPSIMIGGVAEGTPSLAGIPFTSSYIVPQDITIGNGSDRTSLLIHQKNSNSRGIVFHGGKSAGLNDKFEQTDPALLTNISIAQDDRLVFNIPKPATLPASQVDMIGLQVTAPQRAIDIFAGSAVTIQSGAGLSGQFGDGSLLMKVGVAGSASGNMAEIATSGTQGQTLTQYGFGTNGGGGKFIWLNPTTAPVSYTGTQQWVAATQRMITPIGNDNNIELLSGGNIKIYANDGVGGGQAGVQIEGAQSGVRLLAKGGVAQLEASSSNPATALNNLIIEQKSERPNSSGTGGELYIISGTQTIIRGNSNQPGPGAFSQRGPSIVLDYKSTGYAGISTPHTRFVGRQTWVAQGQGSSTPIDSIQKRANLNGILEGIYNYTQASDAVPGFMVEANTFMPLSTSQGDSGNIATRIADESTGANSFDPLTLQPLGYPKDAFDRSISIQSFNGSLQTPGVPTGANFNYGVGNEQFFSFSRNKVSWATPWVISRSQERNSGKNYNPTTDLTKDENATENLNNTQRYGVNTLSKFSPTNAVGMPTQADLAKSPSMIQITFAPSNNDIPLIGTPGNPADIYQPEVAPMGIQPRPTDFNGPVVYDWTETSGQGGFYFPVGAYPGQRIILILRHFTTTYSQARVGSSGLDQLLAYGDIDILVPTARRRSYLTSGGNAGNGNWTNWYGTLAPTYPGLPVATKGYATFSLNADEQDGLRGAVVEQTIEMVWDGTSTKMLNNGSGNLASFPTPAQPTGSLVEVQFGWQIINRKLIPLNGLVSLASKYPCSGPATSCIPYP